MPARMTGHWRLESAAHRRGASKQSQVENNSCASVAATVKPSKASLRARHGGSTCEDGNRRSTERGRNRNGPGIAVPACRPTMAGRSQLQPAKASHSRPRPATGGQTRESTGQSKQPLGQGVWTVNRSHSQPMATLRPSMAGRSQPRPAKAGRGRLRPATLAERDEERISWSRPVGTLEKLMVSQQFALGLSH